MAPFGRKEWDFDLPKSPQVCEKQKSSELSSLKGTMTGHKPASKYLAPPLCVASELIVSLNRLDCLKLCLAWAGLLQVCPLRWKLRTSFYGWVGKWPTRQTSEKLFGAQAHSFQAELSASRNLRKILAGALTDLQISLLTRTWGQFRRRAEGHGFPQVTLPLLC